MTLSKTQVDKLGDRLRRCEVPSDDDLRLLSRETLLSTHARYFKTVAGIARSL